jgi:hypothetical protein
MTAAQMGGFSSLAILQVVGSFVAGSRILHLLAFRNHAELTSVQL